MVTDLPRAMGAWFGARFELPSTMTRQSDIYRRIKINVRRVLEGNGRVIEDANVLCPNGDVMVSMDRCATCGQCDGLVFDGRPGHSLIICKKVPTPSEAHRSAARERPPEVTIGEVMTRDVTCVSADLDVDVVAELLLAKRIGGVPVVDDAGKPIGVISKSDLVRERFIAAGSTKTAGEVMMPVALTLPENAPIYAAAALMTEQRVHRVPVVAEDGRVVGIVSTLDVLRQVACENGYLIPRR